MHFHKNIRFIKQKDSMQCGVASLCMICNYMGIKCSTESLEKKCSGSKEGVSMLALIETAKTCGLNSIGVKIRISDLKKSEIPCILHWNQNHFVVLYKIDKDGNRFWIADPGKGKYKLSEHAFKESWTSTHIGDEDAGIAMFFEMKNANYGTAIENNNHTISLKFLWKYIFRYKHYLFHIVLGLGLGCALQLIMPFLTQAIVDLGIKHQDIGLIWLILIGELMIVMGRTTMDFIRRWLLLHVSMRINISLVSDFFIKLLKLPMSYFDKKLMGDLMQRIGDHSRVQEFLTGRVLSIIFTFLSFIIFGIVLFIYNTLIFGVFAIGGVCYGLWITTFLKKRKVLDYELGCSV